MDGKYRGVGLSSPTFHIHVLAMPLDGRRVLILAAPLYEDLELWYPKIRLEEEGATTTPGGFAPDTLRRSTQVLQLTREIYQAGKPVAFICRAGWVPISAKILAGKRATSVRAIKDDMENAGALWEDAAVVVDGNPSPPGPPPICHRSARR